MLCPSMPILPQQSSQNFCMFRVAKKLPHPFQLPFCWRPGGYAPSLIPADTDHHPLSGLGWTDPNVWLHKRDKFLPLNQDTITHPSTNRARCRATALMTTSHFHNAEPASGCIAHGTFHSRHEMCQLCCYCSPGLNILDHYTLRWNGCHLSNVSMGWCGESHL